MLFENTGQDFANLSQVPGSISTNEYAARGLAVGDYDNDGDPDVLVSTNGEAPLLLRNSADNQNGWIGLRLLATKSNPEAGGAVIWWRVEGVERRRFRTSGGSFLSSHDPREIPGVGTTSQADSIEVHWPSGAVDRMTDVPAAASLTLREGDGIVD